MKCVQNTETINNPKLKGHTTELQNRQKMMRLKIIKNENVKK